MTDKLEGYDGYSWIIGQSAHVSQTVSTGFNNFATFLPNVAGPVDSVWRIDHITLDLRFVALDVTASGSVWMSSNGSPFVPLLSVGASAAAPEQIYRRTVQLANPFYITGFTEFGIDGQYAAIGNSILSAWIQYSRSFVPPD